MKDTSASVRWNAAVALRNATEKGIDISITVPALVEALKDTNADVRRNVVWALITLINKKIGEREYFSVVRLLQETTATLMEFYKKRRDRISLKERREVFGKLDGLGRRIYDALNQLDGHEPIGWKLPKASKSDERQPRVIRSG